MRANQPPAIAITTAPTTVDSNAELALAATATPPEPGQALTIAWTATGGTFNDDSGPIARWTAPAPTLDTTYTITATATDALGAENVATVDITVRRALVPPTAAITTPRQTVDGRTVVALQLNAATAIGKLTYIWSADPPAGRFDSHTAQDPSWTAPTPSRRTDYTLSVTVRNEDGLTATAAVVITVRLTTLAAADMALEVGQTLDAKLAAASTLTGPVSYSMTNLPPDAAFTASTRVLTWTPSQAAAHIVTYTATDAADNTEVIRFLLIAHPPGEPQYAILIDWDGDGSFSHPLTDTFADLTKGGVRTTRGRNYASMIYGRSVAGTLEATLVNHEGGYDRLASSDLSGLVLPRRRLIFMLAINHVAYRLWSGFLDTAKKIARTGGNDVVRLKATDIIGNLARTDCGVGYKPTTTAAGAVTAVLDAADIHEDDRGAIAGPTQINNYFATDAKALLHLRELEETEAGFLFVTGSGKINFEHVNSRYIHTRSRQAQVTITDAESYKPGDLLILPQPQQHDPLKDIANIVTVQVRHWSEAIETDLWRLAETVELTPGETIRLKASAGDKGQGRDPISGRYGGQRDQAVAAWIEPIAYTDFTANSLADGSGTDRTASVAPSLVGAGTSARLNITNTHATAPIYLTLMKVRGQLLTELKPVVLEMQDDESIADYGPRPYTVASGLLGSINEARTYGQYILTLYAQPSRKAEVSLSMSDHRAHAGTLELSDRVEYIARGLASDMYVENIGHSLQPGYRHDIRVTLSQAGLFDDVIIIDGGPGLDTGILGA